MSVLKKSFQYGQHSVSIETGEVARQARPRSSCRWATPSSSSPRSPPRRRCPGKDFFPLTVNYIEKTYAAGRIPGGFFKREGRPTEKETLTSRLIDRPIRPLFPDGFFNEVQVVAHGRVDGSGYRRRHPVADRRLRRAVAGGRAVRRPHRRRARRLQEWQVPAEPDAQGAQGIAAAPRRRGHREVGAHGRVRSLGPVRRSRCSAPWCSATSRCRSRSRPSTRWLPRSASRSGTGSRTPPAPSSMPPLPRMRRRRCPTPTSSPRSRIALRQGQGDQGRRIARAVGRRCRQVHRRRRRRLAVQAREQHRPPAHPQR